MRIVEPGARRLNDDVSPDDAARGAWIARRLTERDRLRVACEFAETRCAELKSDLRDGLIALPLA